jgi:hypothetical protein
MSMCKFSFAVLCLTVVMTPGCGKKPDSQEVGKTQTPVSHKTEASIKAESADVLPPRPLVTFSPLMPIKSFSDLGITPLDESAPTIDAEVGRIIKAYKGLPDPTYLNAGFQPIEERFNCINPPNWPPTKADQSKYQAISDSIDVVQFLAMYTRSSDALQLALQAVAKQAESKTVNRLGVLEPVAFLTMHANLDPHVIVTLFNISKGDPRLLQDVQVWLNLKAALLPQLPEGTNANQLWFASAINRGPRTFAMTQSLQSETLRAQEAMRTMDSQFADEPSIKKWLNDAETMRLTCHLGFTLGAEYSMKAGNASQFDGKMVQTLLVTSDWTDFTIPVAFPSATAIDNSTLQTGVLPSIRGIWYIDPSHNIKLVALWRPDDSYFDYQRHPVASIQLAKVDWDSKIPLGTEHLAKAAAEEKAVYEKAEQKRHKEEEAAEAEREAYHKQHGDTTAADTIDPNSPEQQMRWILTKLENNGGNCAAIATSIRTFISATGRYESQQIDKLLYTARRMGCI